MRAVLLTLLVLLVACGPGSDGSAGTMGVPCGSAPCTGSTPVCCVQLTPGSFAQSCVATTALCMGSPLECDEAADCTGGRVCCARAEVTATGATQTARCLDRCAPTDGELCTPSSPRCASGSRCCPLGASAGYCRPMSEACTTLADGGR